VLRSGLSTSNCQATRNYRTDWVCGGAAVWRLDVLRRHPHRELPSRWAISEDVIYSYGISRSLPMYVCASARVRHEHVFDYTVARPYRFYGRTQTLWVFHFVQSSADLSIPAFLWMVAGTAIGRAVVGVATLRARHLQFALGQIEAVLKVFGGRLRGEDAAAVIEHEARATGA
jgi:hypothetical protein